MIDGTPADIRKGIRFFTGLLVFMAVLSVLAIVQAVRSEHYILILTVLPLFVAAGPLTRLLLRLRATTHVQGDPAHRW